MNERELIRLVEGLGRPRVLIVGDLILDRYVAGDVSRISPEAPIPILTARSSDERLGGAANVAANLRAMEADVEVLGVVGDDPLGRTLLGLMQGIGIETGGCVRDPDRPTTEKTRLVGGVQQMLRVDWEKSSALSLESTGRLLAGLERRVRAARAVVLSDYAKGVLTRDVIRGVIAAARKAGVPVLVDPKGGDYTIYRGATLVTPNKKEAEQAVGRKLAALDDLPRAAQDLMRIAELDAAVITLGPEGMFFQTRDGRSGRIPTVARQVFDVVGAGDTVIAELALGLASGLDLEHAVALANQAAGLVVGKRGAASVTREELKVALGERTPGAGKVLAPGDVRRLCDEWRAEGKRIVFTNGCFDVLHAGHVSYLRFARSKGDRLLIGVNDDASVRRLKGAGRPVNGLADRMEVLAALEMVDAVAPFGEDTPAAIVEEATPHVLVKGEDWAEKGVVGREWVEERGGEVVLAPLLPGRSTTRILERGAKLAPPGARRKPRKPRQRRTKR
jgi:D-beta-D-heptose 7-phosphate kinase/D-beta-D-heptose 1-phosphate adenosyltransferase